MYTEEIIKQFVAEREDIIAHLKASDAHYVLLNEEISQLTKNMRELEELKRRFDGTIEWLKNYPSTSVEVVVK